MLGATSGLRSNVSDGTSVGCRPRVVVLRSGACQDSIMVTWLRIVVSCFCLVTCVLFTASWVRSYFRADSVATYDMRFNQWRSNTFQIARGRLCFQQGTQDGEPSPREMQAIFSKGRLLVRHWLITNKPMWAGPKSTYIGFAYNSSTNRSGKRFLSWSLPHWFLVSAMAILAFVVKPKPRWQFGLRELFLIFTFGAIAAGSLALVLRMIGPPNP